MSKSERVAARTAYETASVSARKIAQSIVQKALEEAGLRKSGTTLASKRESKAGGPDVVTNSLFAEYGIDAGVNGPEIQEALAVIQGKSKSGHVVVRVPLLTPPRLSRVNPKARLEFAELLESYTAQIRYTMEAVTTATSGAALGVDEMTPALVVSTNLAALLRDTVLFRALPQGVDRARFQTVTIPAAGSLSEDTEPSQSTQTLATVDTTTSPRGVETDISFEAERKIIGPILDAMILADRLSELYDEDGLILGSVGSGGFENALSNVPAANKYYGDGTVSAENQVTSTMVFAAKAAAFAQKAIKTQGYAPDNLVLVLHPKQFNDLLNDSNIVRYLQWWFGSSDSGQALIAQGIIPNLYGLEVRQSTLVKTATGTTAGVTTYHAWAYKKGLSAAMAASRDVMIETFRDIRKNATVLKAHWDISVNVLHPASAAYITTA